MKLDTNSLAGMLLPARCIMTRVNPIAVLAVGVFGIGLLSIAIWIPYLQQELKQSQSELSRSAQAGKVNIAQAVVIPSQSELRMQQFYATLGENGYAEQQLKTMFELASKSGLKLNQGEYKSSFDRNDETEAYQIQLPVVGPYPAIREFCESVLLAIPFASLDEISFKREAISSNNLEAKLRFTLYLSGSKKIVAVQP